MKLAQYWWGNTKGFQNNMKKFRNMIFIQQL